MPNKKAKQKKSKQGNTKTSGQKSGMMSQDMGSPSPMKKKKK